MASEENPPPRQGSDPNDRIQMAQDALDLAQSRPNFIPNASKLKQMGQSMSSLLGQLPSLSRTSTMNASPTTPLSPQAERMIQSVEESSEPEEFKSLLHKKLYQRNTEVYKTIQTNVNENYTKMPQKLKELGMTLDNTQGTFQDSVMALQQANHHCAETFWSMDDSINIASGINFPNVWNYRWFKEYSA